MIALLCQMAATAQAPWRSPRFSRSLLSLVYCFVGPLPGSEGTDRHCFESVYGGQHVRDRHVVTVCGKSVIRRRDDLQRQGRAGDFHLLELAWTALARERPASRPTYGASAARSTAHRMARNSRIATSWKLRSDGYDVSSAGVGAAAVQERRLSYFGLGRPSLLHAGTKSLLASQQRAHERPDRTGHERDVEVRVVVRRLVIGRRHRPT